MTNNQPLRGFGMEAQEVKFIPFVMKTIVVHTLTYWVEHPKKRWSNWLLGVIFVIVLILPVMGLLFS
jgi:hypothetical protein